MVTSFQERRQTWVPGGPETKVEMEAQPVRSHHFPQGPVKATLGSVVGWGRGGGTDVAACSGLGRTSQQGRVPVVTRQLRETGRMNQLIPKNGREVANR